MALQHDLKESLRCTYLIYYQFLVCDAYEKVDIDIQFFGSLTLITTYEALIEMEVNWNVITLCLFYYW